MSELFGEAIARTCTLDRDRAIFQLAYGASLYLYKLGDECELWGDDLFERAMKKLEKIKRMTNDTYDEIARVTGATLKEQEEQEDD